MEVYITLMCSVVTAIVTFLIAKGKQTQRRDMFYEGKITALMEAQEKKITELQKEVARLTAINLELLEKIIHLEGELSKYDAKIDRSFAE
jgi:peptidoglycan hydrolase CwlO-like protein